MSKLLTLVSLVGLSLLSTASLVLADEIVRPRRGSQLPLGTSVDVGYRVTTARVVIFNRSALERDFPYLRGQSDHVIETWILDNFAYINELQLRLTGIRNSPIQVDRSKSKRLFIPPGVGRGAVVETNEKNETHSGLVDIKASGNSSWNLEMVNELETQARASEAGLLSVREKDHSSGLERYDLGTAEYLRQLEIQDDYNRRNRETDSNHQTVESYFLIDLGFKVLYPSSEIPAFLYGRQSHFGRRADNRPLPEEIYKDKGQFQETFTGSRIDFGGARTRSESSEAYHETMKRFSPNEAAEFIREKSQSFRNQPVPQPGQMVDTETARQFLQHRYGHDERAPRPEAIGRHGFDMNPSWAIDHPLVARIKWTLAELKPRERLTYVNEIGTESMANLFRLSTRDFQMPLPADLYLYGISHANEDVARSAANAAVRVFKRFPNLETPTVRIALRELRKARHTWAPNVIQTLIDTNFEFKNADAFIMSVLRIGNTHSTNAIIYQLSLKPDDVERTERVLEWINKHSKDQWVLKEAHFRFPQKMSGKACRDIFKPTL